jgi:hypothetical protein
VTGVGHTLSTGQHCQVSDTQIDPDDRVWTGRGAHGQHALDGERAVPAAALPADRGGQDPGGAGLQAAGKLAGGLMRLDPPHPGQGDMAPVGLDVDRPRGEPHGGHGTAARAEPRKAGAAAITANVLGDGPVVQRAGHAVQPSIERFLGALGPPGCNHRFSGVPGPAQRRQVPPQGRGQLLLADSIGPLSCALGQVDLDRCERPVEGEPSRARMPFQVTNLGR